MKRFLFAPVALLCLSLLMVGCGSEEEKNEEAATTATATQVKVTEVNLADVAQIDEFTASIDPFVMNHISSQMGLRIDDIKVEVGDQVKKGQLLVEMDSRQYLQSKIQLDNTKLDYQRMEELYKAGGISKQQVDQLKTQLDVLEHATETLEENHKLKSPITGVVTARAFDAGDVFTPGATGILTIMQVDLLKVKVNIPERYVPDVKLGMSVEILSEVYPTEVFVGKVSLISPAVDAMTRTFSVEITVANGDGKLKPGMTCKAVMAFGVESHVLVPDISVLKQSGSSERYLFVINPDGTASRRTVEIGRIVGTTYEIISGVSDGENVVIAGMQKLIDGDKVEIVK